MASKSRKKLVQQVYRARKFLREFEISRVIPETATGGALADFLEVEKRRAGRGKKGYLKSDVDKLLDVVKDIKKTYRSASKKGLSKEASKAVASFSSFKKFASRRPETKSAYKKLDFSKGKLLSTIKNLVREDFYEQNRDLIGNYNQARAAGDHASKDAFGGELKGLYDNLDLSTDRKILGFDINYEVRQLQQKLAKRGGKIIK